MQHSRGSLFWFLFSLRGRISRIEFWAHVLATILLGISGQVAFIIVVKSLMPEMWPPQLDPLDPFLVPGDLIVGAAFLGYLMLALVTGLLVAAKRLHDRDKSAWWVIVGLVPVLGQLWLLVEAGMLKGTEGPNRFGSDPRGLRLDKVTTVFE